MRTMKDSGVEWIGEIPEGWEVTRIKSAYTFQTGWTPSTDKEENFSGDNIWANISDLKKNVIFDTAKRISDDAVEKSSMKISPMGSLMYAFKLSVGAVSFCGVDMYTNEAIASFLQGNNCLKYLYYMAPIFIIMNANENIYGAKILNQYLIRNAKIILPPIDIQHRIANYLDIKCSKIDAIIAGEQAVIEKLKEYKLSLITEAVTKGLNPDAEMKDSGVEWIGEMPEHWNLLKLSRLILSTQNGLARRDLSESKGTAVLKLKNISENGKIDYTDINRIELTQSELERFTLRNGDFLFVRVNGSKNLVGKCAVFHQYSEIVAYNDHIIRVQFSKKCDINYIQWCLLSSPGKKEVERHINTAAGQFTISGDGIRDINITYPNVAEQKRISDFLNTKCSQIDSAISRKQALIDKLGEYKKSLIYEVVTGKTEV